MARITSLMDNARMPLPVTDHQPSFDITRMSHVVLEVAELDASVRFYTEVLGLIVTVADDRAAYLRGVEEACHHSLVLCEGSVARCRRVGMRVRTERDLDRAKRHYDTLGLAAEWAQVPHQHRTLIVQDPSGVVMELCAGMPTESRQSLRFDQLSGAAAKGLDHVQILVPDVLAAASFYARLGFRISGYASENGSPDGPFRSIFMARKGNANDLVLLQNAGPRLHHFAWVVGDPSLTLPRVCDLLASLGQRHLIEWGPGRHGLGYEQFLYLHDPDGHRVELLGHPYQFIDLEDPPDGWSTSDPGTRHLWGPDAPGSWFAQASPLGEEQRVLPT